MFSLVCSALCAQEKLEIQIFAHDIRIGSATIEIIGGVDQLILPNRFVGEDRVIFVDEDEIDITVPTIGELCKDI